MVVPVNGMSIAEALALLAEAMAELEGNRADIQNLEVSAAISEVVHDELWAEFRKERERLEASRRRVEELEAQLYVLSEDKKRSEKSLKETIDDLKERVQLLEGIVRSKREEEREEGEIFSEDEEGGPLEDQPGPSWRG